MKARTLVKPSAWATGQRGPSADLPALRRHMLHRQFATPPTHSGHRHVPLALAASADSPSLLLRQWWHHCSEHPSLVHTALYLDVVWRQQWHAE